MARHVIALTERDADIAIYLTVLQDPKRLSIYGLAHSVHCAMICLLMARRLGWAEAETLTLMKARAHDEHRDARPAGEPGGAGRGADAGPAA
jgi:hypothetical protein